MKILASKFLYPKDLPNLENVLSPFEITPIQLSFFLRKEFFQMKHRHIKEACNSLDIEIPTVHAPTVDVFHQEFLDIMRVIREVYQVGIITIHPQKGESNEAMKKLEEYAKVIEDLGIVLAYENFPSYTAKRKWITQPAEMHSKFNLPFLKLTFDTSHLDSPSNCVEEFDKVSEKVAVVHLSDASEGKEHLPLGTGCVPYEKFLRHLQAQNFQGYVVIEYMEKFESKLIQDTKELTEKFFTRDNSSEY